MFIRKLGYKIGKVQARRPWLFVLLAILLTVATIPGIPMLLHHVEPSLEKVLPQDLEEVKVMNDMRSAYGADMLYIVLTAEESNTDIYSPSNLKYIDSLSQSLRGIDNVREVTSIADIIKEKNGNIPLEKNQVIAVAKQDPHVAQYVNADRSITVIMVRSDTGASAATVKKVMEDIKFNMATLENRNPGLSAQVTGFNAIDQATFKVIISDFARITIISFVLMIAFLLVYYRFNIKKTVYSMIIMMLSLIWALGVTGYLGIQLNVVTMVAAAMIMALGSSYGINSVYHFYDDFLIQYPRNEAIAKFQEFLIVGLSGSAFAEIAGFLALLFGIMPSMRSLGIILGIGIFFALFVSVMILPAFFFLLERDTKEHEKSKSLRITNSAALAYNRGRATSSSQQRAQKTPARPVKTREGPEGSEASLGQETSRFPRRAI
jgi:predicted RND superfamily exporter protein